MRSQKCFVTLVLITASSVATAKARECTIRHAKQADAAVDTVTSWDRIYFWYTHYRQCDDGGVAEGVTEQVARNLVDRWHTLPRLSELARKEAGFGRFVLKHIDPTLNTDDLTKIDNNAQSRCPAELRSFCDALSKQSRVALKEQSQ